MSQLNHRKRGRVKWYNERRGYGFIEVDDHEVFIHRSILQEFGIIRIQNEDIVTVTQVKTDRGYIVEHLYGIERPPLPDWLYATTAEDGEKMAEVKFFNEEKGYGFIMVEDYAEDIFVHSRTLEESRITGLTSGQRVLVRLSKKADEIIIDSIRFHIGPESEKPLAGYSGSADDENFGNRTKDGEAIALEGDSMGGKAFYDLTRENS